jgi:hypothetical protein
MTYLRQAMISTILCTMMGAAALAAEGDTPAAPVAEEPDATIDLTGGSVAAGVGIVWGHGNLTFQGKKYPFNLAGLSAVDVGAAHLDANGKVYHLKDLNDFNGTYTATSAGMTVVSGGSAAVLRNEHGVVIKVIASTKGLRFNLSANGISVKLKT